MYTLQVVQKIKNQLPVSTLSGGFSIKHYYEKTVLQTGIQKYIICGFSSFLFYNLLTSLVAFLCSTCYFFHIHYQNLIKIKLDSKT